MSKYQPLWEYVKNSNEANLILTFNQIKDILGIPIDHSFLNFKKELLEYGYQVNKISLKAQTVVFEKIILKVR